MAETPTGPKKPTKKACRTASIWGRNLWMASTQGRRRKSKTRMPSGTSRYSGMTALTAKLCQGQPAPYHIMMDTFSSMSTVGWRLSSICGAHTRGISSLPNQIRDIMERVCLALSLLSLSLERERERERNLSDELRKHAKFFSPFQFFHLPSQAGTSRHR